MPERDRQRGGQSHRHAEDGALRRKRHADRTVHDPLAPPLCSPPDNRITRATSAASSPLMPVQQGSQQIGSHAGVVRHAWPHKADGQAPRRISHRSRPRPLAIAGTESPLFRQKHYAVRIGLGLTTPREPGGITEGRIISHPGDAKPPARLTYRSARGGGGALPWRGACPHPDGASRPATAAGNTLN